MTNQADRGRNRRTVVRWPASSAPIEAAARAFTAEDLVMLDRVSDPQLVARRPGARLHGARDRLGRQPRPHQPVAAGARHAGRTARAPYGQRQQLLVAALVGGRQVAVLPLRPLGQQPGVAPRHRAGRGTTGHEAAARGGELRASRRMGAGSPSRSACLPTAPTSPARKKRVDGRDAEQGLGHGLRRAVHPPLGRVGRRPPLAAVPRRAGCQRRRRHRCAPPDARHQRRRALEAVRRRRGVRLLRRRPHAVLRRAHPGRQGALVDELRRLRGRDRRRQRAAQPDGRQSGLGCRTRCPRATARSSITWR